MKTTILILALFTAICYAGTHIPAGLVNGVWEATGSPYMIDGDINVPTDDSLIIEPGCSLIFTGHYSLTVDSMALFKAIGTIYDSIVFTAQDTVLTDSLGGHEGINLFSSAEACSISFCIIEYGNTFFGGAIEIRYTDPVIYSNLIRYNSAAHGIGGQGGGIHCWNSSAIIKNNVIRNNSAENVGGGIRCSGMSSCRIINNLILNNSVIGWGGGIGCDSGHNWIINNTIVGNTLLGPNGGGGVYVNGGAILLNNIIYYNYDPLGRDEIYGSAIVFFSDIDTDYCNSDVVWGDGNINYDPIFSDTTTLKYHLSEISPCIDAGVESVYVSMLDTTFYAPDHDIEGNPRPLGAGYDIGAYEYSSTDPFYYTLSLQSNPSGGPTIINGLLAASISVPESTVVQISCVATFPGAGDTTYTFSHWSCGGSRTRNYTVTANETLTAYYDTVVAEYSLSLVTNPVGGQTYIDGAPSSSTTVPSGTEVEISCEASFSSGGSTYNFSHWSCGGARTQDYIVNSTETLTAYYDEVVLHSDSRGWTHGRRDIQGTNYYPWGSTIHTGAFEEEWSWDLPTYERPYILSGDVNGDGQLEIVTVQEDTLYILSSSGVILLQQYIGIVSQDFIELSMLEDVTGDSILEIGVGYYRPEWDDGDWYARIYNGSGTLIQEFYKDAGTDGGMYPLFTIGNEVIIRQSSVWRHGTPYPQAVRGFSRWDISSADSIWTYDVGPYMSALSVADIDGDDTLEISSGSSTPHNGSAGHGTTDGDCWTIIINENGNNVLTQIYSVDGEPNGGLEDMLLKFTDSGPFYILSFKNYGASYHGTARVHIRSTDGTILHTKNGLYDTGWTFAWADMDGDGVQDIVCSNGNTSTNTVFILDTLLDTKDSLLIEPGFIIYAIGDIDGDDEKEVILASRDSSTVICLSWQLELEWSWTDPLMSTIHKVIITGPNEDGRDEVIVLTEDRIVALGKSEGDCITVFEDDFENLDNWELWGSPLPIWVDSIHGRDGIFDNNGDPSYHSGAISRERFDLSNGFIIESEVYLDFYNNPSGCWAGPALGIGDTLYGSTGGNVLVRFRLEANGTACWASPDSLHGHSYFSGSYYINDTDEETFGAIRPYGPFNADAYEGGWHVMKIEVDEDWVPSFYIDDYLIYAGMEPVAEFVMENLWPLYLGERSSGSAGKAYHDWINLCLFETETCSHLIIPDAYSICALDSILIYIDVCEDYPAFFTCGYPSLDTVEPWLFLNDTTFSIFIGTGLDSLYLAIWDTSGIVIGDTVKIDISSGPEFEIIADPSSNPSEDSSFKVWTTADPVNDVYWEWESGSWEGDTLYFSPDGSILYVAVSDSIGCSNSDFAVYQPGHSYYTISCYYFEKQDTICCGDSLHLCAGGPGVDSIYWYISTDTLEYAFLASDTNWCFWLKSEYYNYLDTNQFFIGAGRFLESYEYIDFTLIHVNCPDFEIIGDTLVCPGDTTSLCIEPSWYTHNWWNDSSDSCILIGPIWEDTTICITVCDTSCNDSIPVDIVFYLDNSGTMHRVMEGILESIVVLLDDLESSGYDWRLGGVLVGNNGPLPKDFNTDSLEYNLTHDIDEFIDWIRNCQYDYNIVFEKPIKSLSKSSKNSNWRNNTNKVIIMFQGEAWYCHNELFQTYDRSLKRNAISELTYIDAITYIVYDSLQMTDYCEPLSHISDYQEIASLKGKTWEIGEFDVEELMVLIAEHLKTTISGSKSCCIDTCITIHVLDEIDRDTSMCVGDTMLFCCNPICDSLGSSRARPTLEIMAYRDGEPVPGVITMESDSCCMKFVPHDPGTYSVWQPNYYDGIHDCCYDVWWHITVCCTPQGSLFVSTLDTLDNGAITYRICFEEVLAYPCDTCCDIDSIAWHYSMDSTRYSCLDDSDCNCSPSPCYCQKGRYNCYGFGNCVPVPDIYCTSDYVPVCGCDGRTYGNSCNALESGINIAYDGECHSIDPLPLIDTLSGIYCDTVTINCFDTVEVCVSAYNFCEGIICSIRVCDTLIGDSCCVCPDCDPKFAVISPLGFDLLTDSLCPWEDLQVCLDLVGDSCPELDSVHWNIFMAPGLDLGITRCITIPYDSLIMEEPILFPVPGWHRFCAEGYYTPPDCYTYCTYNLCDSVYIHPCDSCCKLVINIECEGDPVCDTVCPGDSVLLCAVLIGDNCPSPDSIDPEWTRDGIRISSFPCAKVAPDSTSTYCFTGWYELASGDTCSYDTCVTIWVISAPNEDLWPEDTILCVGDSLVLPVPCYPYIPIGWEDSTATISPSYIAAFAYEDSITESDPDTIAFLDISSLPPSWCYVSHVARVPGCWEHIVCYDVYTEECGWYKWVECCTIYVCDTPSVQINMDSVVCPDKEMAEICVTNINTSASMDTIVWISSGGTQITVWPDTCVSIPLNVITTPCGGINSFEPETVIVKAGHKCIDCGPDEIVCWDYDTVVIKPSFEFGLDFRPPAVHPGDPFTIYPWTNPSFAGVFPPVEWDIQQCRNDSLVGVLRHNAFGDSVIVSYTDSTTVYCCWFTYQGCEYWACDTMVFSESLLTIIKAPCAGDPDGWQELDGGRVYDECIHTFPVSGGSANICVSDTDFVMTDVWMFDYWSLDDIGASAYSLESCTTYTPVSSHDTIYAQYQEQSMCLSVVPVQSDSSFLTIEGTLLLVDTLELGIDYIDPLIVSVCDTIITGTDTLILCPGESFTALNINDPKKFEFTNCGTAILSIKVKWNSLDILSPWCSSIMLTNSAIPGTNELGLRFSYSTSPGIPTSYSVLKNYYQELLPDLNPGETNYLYMGVVAPKTLEGCYGPIPSIPLRIQLTIVWGVSLP